MELILKATESEVDALTALYAADLPDTTPAWIKDLLTTVHLEPGVIRVSGEMPVIGMAQVKLEITADENG